MTPYFRIFRPTNIIIKPKATITGVIASPGVPDAKVVPAAVPPLEETMTANSESIVLKYCLRMIPLVLRE
jgi:hypothetical protein